MSIHRHTSKSVMKELRWCDECHKDKPKGYILNWFELATHGQAFFVCDDCLAAARYFTFSEMGREQIIRRPQPKE